MVTDVTKVVKVNESNVGVSSESNILLLDMRDKSDYDAWHIKDALSYSIMLLNQDKTFPQLHAFKNKANKMICVYSSDERNGMICATTMVERGYGNTCLLTGGIEKFMESQYDFLEGNNVPAKPAPAKKGVAKK